MNKNDQIKEQDFEKAKKNVSEYISVFSKEKKKVTKEDFEEEVARVFHLFSKTNDKESIGILQKKIEALKDFKTLIVEDDKIEEYPC